MIHINRKLITSIQVLLIGVVIFSTFQIYGYSQNLKQTDNIEMESRALVQELKGDMAQSVLNGGGDSEKDIVSISLDFIDELKQSYPEAVGHIEIDDTRISYPIVQHKDNEYYLTHSPDKNVNANGSIFLDYRNSPNLDDDNNIIYGHYIKSGKLFHNLYKFRNQAFFDTVDTVELQTFEGPKTYKIFSVYDTDPAFQYRYVTYDDKDEKRKFINQIADKSLIDVGEIEELSNDEAKILTLSTCSNRGKTRLVVHGVEISN